MSRLRNQEAQVIVLTEVCHVNAFFRQHQPLQLHQTRRDDHVIDSVMPWSTSY
jgi:hypothetical protein